MTKTPARRIRPEPQSLDPRAPVPLYFQLKERLKQQIADLMWKPDELMPSENELAAAYRVSVGTVKKALGELVRERILARRRGKGTFVTPPNFSLSFVSRFSPFGSEAGEARPIPGSQVLSTRVVAPPQQVAEILRLGRRESVVAITRVRTLYGLPFAVEDLFLPARIFRGFEKRDISRALLYPIYDAEYSTRIVRAEEFLEPRAAPAEAAGHLGLRAAAPVLYIERIAYTFGDRPVEYRQGYARGGRVRYRVELH